MTLKKITITITIMVVIIIIIIIITIIHLILSKTNTFWPLPDSPSIKGTDMSRK